MTFYTLLTRDLPPTSETSWSQLPKRRLHDHCNALLLLALHYTSLSYFFSLYFISLACLNRPSRVLHEAEEFERSSGS